MNDINKLKEELNDLKESVDLVPKNMKAAIEAKIKETESLISDIEANSKKVSKAEEIIAKANVKIKSTSKKTVDSKPKTAAKVKAVKEKVVAEKTKSKATVEKNKVVKEITAAKKTAAEILSKYKNLSIKDFNKGRSQNEIIDDLEYQAKAPGKRVSASGNTYYEGRPNRSDISSTKKLESGGELKSKIDFINKNYKNVKASKMYSSDRVQVVSEDYNTLSKIEQEEFLGNGLIERYGNLTSVYVLYELPNIKMAKGGSIENQYSGKSASEVWDMWTVKQRTHFLRDHLGKGLNEKVNWVEKGFNTFTIRDIGSINDYNKLPDLLKIKLREHIHEGEYVKGGEISEYKKGGYLYEIEKKGHELSLQESLIGAKNVQELKDKIKDKFGSLDGITARRRGSRGAFYYVNIHEEGGEMSTYHNGGGIERKYMITDHNDYPVEKDLSEDELIRWAKQHAIDNDCYKTIEYLQDAKDYIENKGKFKDDDRESYFEVYTEYAHGGKLEDGDSFHKGDKVKKRSTGEKAEVIRRNHNGNSHNESYVVKCDSGKEAYWWASDMEICYECGGMAYGGGGIIDIENKIKHINKSYKEVSASKMYSSDKIQVVSTEYNTLQEIKKTEFSGNGLIEKYGNLSSVYVLYEK